MTAWPKEGQQPDDHDHSAPEPGDELAQHPPDLEPSDARVRWGLGDVWAGLAVGLVGSNLVAVAWLIATGNIGDPEAVADAPIALIQAGLWLGLLGAPLRATYRKGRRSMAADFGLRGKGSDVPFGLAAGVVTQLVLIPLLYLPILWFLDDPDLGGPAREITERAQGFGVVMLVLTVVIGAPLVEEIFFRGLALRAFERRWGTTWGVALSSVLFGLTHFQLLQLPALVAFGVVLGVLTVRTGRLMPAIWAHVVFNGTAVASQLLL